MSNGASAVVIDANVVIAIVANEAGEPAATAAIGRHLNAGARFYAPGVIVAESLYVLCGKLAAGELTTSLHAQAVTHLERLLTIVHGPPSEDKSLVRRAEAIRGSLSCRRSADGIYIALAAELAMSQSTILLTFDQGMSAAASGVAGQIVVELLIP